MRLFIIMPINSVIIVTKSTLFIPISKNDLSLWYPSEVKDFVLEYKWRVGDVHGEERTCANKYFYFIVLVFWLKKNGREYLHFLPAHSLWYLHHPICFHSSYLFLPTHPWVLWNNGWVGSRRQGTKIMLGMYCEYTLTVSSSDWVWGFDGQMGIVG